MPTVQVITLDHKREDVMRGTISLGPAGVQTNPPDDPLLKRMTRPFRSSWKNRVIGPQDGQEFLAELPRRYQSAYLRAILIPDQPSPTGNVGNPSPTPPDAPTPDAPPIPAQTS